MFADLHAHFDAMLEEELAREDRAFKASTNQLNQRSHQSHAAIRPMGAALPHLKGGEV
ncbi:hypothetical protein [Ruegeria arenilitoris]|uniref:hypothetical protein n=1 Tax=Ruegeria arenilitoris TaxID=1173585 RepID=UPI00147B8E6D|nr:hypothetical protein [Ruegeria arenilitoris]